MYSKYAKRLVNTQASFDFVAAHFACEQDKYSTKNPNGFVNFGSAQNLLSKTEVAQRLESLQWESDDTPYRKFIGTDACRDSVATYLQDISGRDIEADIDRTHRRRISLPRSGSRERV